MSSLPSYVAAAQAVPQDKRGPWYANVAPTYAGIMLWFVFWQSIPGASDSPGGILACGIGPALIGLVIAAAICHFLFYLVPGMLGMKTGLPLYVVGTSVYGVYGGLILPGLVMGLLQFGWLAVNAAGVATLLCKSFGLALRPEALGSIAPAHAAIAAVFAIAAAFMGMKGIQYIAKVATFLPLIPLAVLVLLAVKTFGGIGSFDPKMVIGTVHANDTFSATAIITVICVYVVGFFATAGAAGTDIASSSRSGSDVQLGGLSGIALATIFAGGMSVLIVAGAYGSGLVKGDIVLNPIDLMKGGLLSPEVSKWIMVALAISSFPAGCFSAFIAANSFKTTMPQVPPFLSVGIGTLVAIAMAVTGVADRVVAVFVVIGASFGPVCGAMVADYLLSGCKWSGPRAGFNPAGWISWVIGFAVGAANFIPAVHNSVPAAPVAAFIVGFVLYIVLAKLGLESEKLPMPSKA